MANPLTHRTLSDKVSHVIMVNFKEKKILGEDIQIFNKQELLREGLISFDRLQRHGEVFLIVDEAS